MQHTDETRHDVGLLGRIVNGDAAAIGELYDRHSRLLYGLIVRILGDRGEAEEVLQDAFVQVWTRARTFDVELGTPVAWLVRIARNRAIDCLRARHARTRVPAQADPPPSFDSPEAHAVLSQQQRVVARALAGLPGDARELLEHAYFLGFTQSELAERFNLPLGTVKTKMRTALRTLRRELEAAFEAQGLGI
jgi:RNA polymerase sigma-70 factor (ECF subfamily)